MSKSQAVSAPHSPSSSALESGRVASAPALAPPTVLGRYALFGRIGAGGMGVVHLGRLLGSAGFERAVAIKRVHPLLARDAQFIAMFRDELRLLARVRHQNVISALDVVEVDGELLLVMEYVHGEALAALLQRTARARAPIPIDIALTIACGVLKGLHAAHTATSAAGDPLGIIHRDVSPHNVLVGCDGLARIVDFGVAKWAESRKVTQVGELRGKPGYVAPEQIVGELASARSDVYALSVVLWEMLAAQRLFGGKSVAETVARVSSGEVPRFATVSQRRIGNAIEAVVRRGLSRDPTARFATAREMAVALEQAGRLVSPEALGEWVSSTAGAPLAERARQLSWTETCVIGDDQSAAADDTEETLVRSLEVREESATRDLPLEVLAPSRASPRAASTAASSVPRWSGRKRALLAAVAMLGVLSGVRLYRNASARAEEAVRARAALAVARAGLSSVAPPKHRASEALSEPSPNALPEPSPSSFAASALAGAVAEPRLGPQRSLSVPAARPPTASRPTPAPKAAATSSARAKPTSIDGF